MKRLLIAGVVLAATFAGAGPVLADPVDDTLEIDGTPIITRTAAPEGHPFDEVYSGWLFRESETRDLSRDSFENPA
jgi:sulfur-oxidizing protein SoxA